MKKERQKYVEVDNQNNILGFYDSIDSASIPEGAIPISKTDWMNALNDGSNKFNGGFYSEEKVLSPEEINDQRSNNRSSAYRDESDKLFMEWQYDQNPASEAVWRAKVLEIKNRYPIV